MFSKKIVATLCLSVLSFNAAADSDNSGWFIGGKIGQVDAHTEMDYTYSRNETGGSFAVYGGYNFTDWFGLEGNIFATDSVAEEDVYVNNSKLIEANYSGLEVTPKFTWQISPNFALFTKGGLAFLTYEEEFRSSNTNHYWQRHYDYTWRGVVLTYGVGAQINIANGVVFRVGFDVTKGSLESDEDRYSFLDVDANLKQTSLGVHYQF